MGDPIPPTHYICACGRAWAYATTCICGRAVPNPSVDKPVTLLATTDEES